MNYHWSQNTSPDGNKSFNIPLETAQCPFGHISKPVQVLTAKDHILSLPGRFHVVRCPECEMMWTSPRPIREAMDFYYPSNYGPYLGTRVKSGGSTKDGVSESFKNKVKSLFDFKTESIPDLPIGRMIEIGCASGAFLHRMQSMGWQVFGVEPSPTAAKNAKNLGIPVYAGSIETAPAPHEPFDLAVGWMVLEHLHAPLDALKTLHQWIRPSGWLALSVPNAGSMEFKVFKEHWYALQVPNHLYHFTPETLSCLLSRAGWQVKRISYQRSLTNIIGSIGIWLKEMGRWMGVAQTMVAFPEKTRLSSYLLYPAALVASSFGQTGRMTVWAKKNDY